MSSALSRPNIVLVLIDDMGWRDLGCYGSSFYETPAIDALAASGTRFTQAYAASPVCSPSRASIMSGKHPTRVGITQYIGGQSVGLLKDVPYFHGLPENEYSLARALRKGGYQTWHVGKWHLGGQWHAPEHHGFDINIAGSDIGSPKTFFAPYSIPMLEEGPDGEYLTDRITNEAIALIEKADDRPFFLNLWHYAVHTPIEAPGALIAKYRAKADAQGLDTEAIAEGEPMSAWHLHGRAVQRRTLQSDPAYAAMVENLDRNMGLLIDALRRVGKLENTLIIFTSDNGGLSTAEGSPTCNAPLAEGKGWMEDGGVRVPFIVSWPGRIPKANSDLVFGFADIYPTLLAAAGLPGIPEQHLDGIDLLECWEGNSPGDPTRPLFWHYPHYSNQGGTPGAAVRLGRYKLIRWFESGREALYDLQVDISERHDIALDLPAERSRLSKLLDDWCAEIGAAIPDPNTMQRF